MDKNLKSTRDAFGNALISIAKNNNKVYALSADLKDSLRLSDFANMYPEQFIECGVAEQNMVGIATGLAASEKIPFATSFGVFNPGRTWDQIRVGVCISNLNVKLVGAHGGLSNHKDGASHQAFEDIAIMRVLPNIKIIVPADYEQTLKLIELTVQDPSPTYIRLSGEPTPTIGKNTSKIKIGEAEVLKQGKELLVLSYGPMLNQVLQAIDKIGVSATVINIHTIKPLDTNIITEHINEIKNVITVEDHQIIGGLGSAVSELIAENNFKNVKFKRFGINNIFGKSSRKIEELYKYFELDYTSLAKNITNFLEEEV